VVLYSKSASAQLTQEKPLTTPVVTSTDRLAQFLKQRNSLVEWQAILEAVYYHKSTSAAARDRVSKAGIVEFKNAIGELNADIAILNASASSTTPEDELFRRQTLDRIADSLTKADLYRKSVAKAVLHHCFDVSDKEQLDLFTK
jgi:hypothetical protein